MKVARLVTAICLAVVVGCSRPQVAPGTRAKVTPKPKPSAQSQEYQVGQQVGVVDEFVQGQ
ncbi:MAG: hypothetical protein HY597_03220 [Candidatus Omnitrophica bacterium]|nr:hypothetical protein [Candidatus Omnitrophota bacterium]